MEGLGRNEGCTAVCLNIPMDNLDSSLCRRVLESWKVRVRKREREGKRKRRREKERERELGLGVVSCGGYFHECVWNSCVETRG